MMHPQSAAQDVVFLPQHGERMRFTSNQVVLQFEKMLLLAAFSARLLFFAIVTLSVRLGGLTQDPLSIVVLWISQS